MFAESFITKFVTGTSYIFNGNIQDSNLSSNYQIIYIYYTFEHYYDYFHCCLIL